MDLGGNTLTLTAFTDPDGTPFTTPGIHTNNDLGAFDGVTFNGGAIEILLIPEPGSMVLLGLSLIGAAMRSR